MLGAMCSTVANQVNKAAAFWSQGGDVSFDLAARMSTGPLLLFLLVEGRICNS